MVMVIQLLLGTTGKNNFRLNPAAIFGNCNDVMTGTGEAEICIDCVDGGLTFPAPL